MKYILLYDETKIQLDRNPYTVSWTPGTADHSSCEEIQQDTTKTSSTVNATALSLSDAAKATT